MDAIVKVLGCSELIETLLTMLDPLSVKRLIQSEVVDKKILKRSLSSKIWAGLIKRSSYGGGGVLVLDDVKDLVAILKFLKLEEPDSFLLPLLNHICESFPPKEGRFTGVALNCPGRTEAAAQGPHLTSSSKWVVEPDYTEPRRVSFQGFPLLEEAEGSFGTKIQRIEKIEVGVLDEPHLSALSSRIVRQENPVASIFIAEIRLGGGLQSAQAFSILLQADRVYVVTLVVSEAIGEEGWRILAKAIRPRILTRILVTKDGLAQGKREDIKQLFDAGCRFLIFKKLEDLQARNKEASMYISPVNSDWSRWERVLDMSEQEFSEEIEGGV